MRHLLALLLLPLVVQSEVLFIESEITTLLKSTYSVHAGTSARMEHGEIYATYMQDMGQMLEQLDVRHKTWGIGYRRYFQNNHQGKFLGIALRTADEDESCTSLVHKHRFYKHTAVIFAFGNRVTTDVAYGVLRGHLSWVIEVGQNQVSVEGHIEKRSIYGISLNWGVSFL